MKWLAITWIFLSFVGIAILTLPIWGMGPAVFLDSERTIRSRTVSPDGKRIAQVERIVVGGVPTIVVKVRPSWMPDWYLSGCAATSHYEEADARVRWTSNSTMEVRHTDIPRRWWIGSAPFHNEVCENLEITLISLPDDTASAGE